MSEQTSGPQNPAPLRRDKDDPAAAPKAAARAEAPSFTPEQRTQIETLSINLARAAMTAQGAIAEMALKNAERPAALTPDPFHVAPALTEVMGRLAAQPDKLMRAQADLYSRYLDLWQTAARRMSGEALQPAASPARGDKRFADPD